jgi:hypothetical protein
MSDVTTCAMGSIPLAGLVRIIWKRISVWSSGGRLMRDMARFLVVAAVNSTSGGGGEDELLVDWWWSHR